MRKSMTGAAVCVGLFGAVVGGVDAGLGSDAVARSASPAAGSAATTTPEASGTPIRIGTLGDNSSPSSIVSKPINDGVVAWAEYVNAQGGINGHPVELIVKDDQGDPARSQTLLRELVEEDNVIALVGTNGFGTDPTWVDYLEEHSIPVVGGSGSTPPWSESPMFYPQAGSTVGRFHAYMRMAVLAGYTQGYALYCAEIAACASVVPVLEQYADAAETELVGNASVSATAADYSALCLTMQRAGADYVILGLPASTAIRVVQSCSQQNYRPHYTTGATNASTEFIELPEADGASVFEAIFAPQADSPGAAAFRDAMSTYSPDTSLNSAANSGWAAGMLFEAAVADVPADREISTQDVLDGLNSMSNETLGGLLAGGLTFEASEPHSTFPCVFYSIVEDGALVPQDEPICAPEL